MLRTTILSRRLRHITKATVRTRMAHLPPCLTDLPHHQITRVMHTAVLLQVLWILTLPVGIPRFRIQWLRRMRMPLRGRLHRQCPSPALATTRSTLLMAICLMSLSHSSPRISLASASQLQQAIPTLIAASRSTKELGHLQEAALSFLPVRLMLLLFPLILGIGLGEVLECHRRQAPLSTEPLPPAERHMIMAMPPIGGIQALSLILGTTTLQVALVRTRWVAFAP